MSWERQKELDNQIGRLDSAISNGTAIVHGLIEGTLIGVAFFVYPLAGVVTAGVVVLWEVIGFFDEPGVVR